MENLWVQGQVEGVVRGLTLFYHLRVLELGGETKRPINDSNTRVRHETQHCSPERGESLIWDALRWLGAGGGLAGGGTAGGAGQR